MNRKIKIILLAGQSNMEGHAHNSYLKLHTEPSQFKTYENGLSVNIAFACDRYGHSSKGEFVNVKLGQGLDASRFGPEIGIGEKIVERHLNDEVMLIKYAVGGTTLSTNWRSLSSGKIGDCYSDFVNFTHECLHILTLKNIEIEIAAICYMQGESDAEAGTHQDYQNNLKCLIHDLRKEFKDYVGAEHPYFIDATISNAEPWVYHQAINDAKKELVKSMPNYILIDTQAHQLEFDKEPYNEVDIYHYDSESMLRLGHLFGTEIIKIINK